MTTLEQQITHTLNRLRMARHDGNDTLIVMREIKLNELIDRWTDSHE